MKRNRLFAIALLVGVFLLGLTGLTMVDAKAAEPSGQDKLIGVLVTTRSLDLFDEQAYVRDNFGRLAKGGATGGRVSAGGAVVIDADTSANEGRLYATLVERTVTNPKTGETNTHKDYAFEGVAGFPYFSATIASEKDGATQTVNGSDPAISDRKSAISMNDGNGVSLEGTIYIVPKNGENTYFFNPVHQSPEGRVYATSGLALVVDDQMTEGATYAQKLDASYAIAEKGKTKTDTISVKVSLSITHPPERIVLLQMDSGSSILSRSEYVPGQLPKSIVPDAKAAYIVTETDKRGPDGRVVVSRSLVGRDAKTMETFFAREDGICVKQFTEIKW